MLSTCCLLLAKRLYEAATDAEVCEGRVMLTINGIKRETDKERGTPRTDESQSTVVKDVVSGSRPRPTFPGTRAWGLACSETLAATQQCGCEVGAKCEGMSDLHDMDAPSLEQ